MNGIFVAVIGTVLDAVAFARVGNATTPFALELILAATLIRASIRLVRIVAAIVFAVAGERHANAVVICALILVRLTSQRSTTLIGMLVAGTLVSTI